MAIEHLLRLNAFNETDAELRPKELQRQQRQVSAPAPDGATLELGSTPLNWEYYPKAE
jgi:hypothetical protein